MAFDYLFEYDKWADDNSDTPPEPLNFVDNDSRYWFNDSLTYDLVSHIGSNQLPATLLIDWEITEAATSGEIYFQYDNNAAGISTEQLGSGGAVGSGQLTITDHDRTAAGFRFSVGDGAASITSGLSNGGVIAIKQVLVSDVNLEYETLYGARTLSDLRTELLRNTGYAGQLANLPTNIEELWTSFLRQAQVQIHAHFPAIETLRYFRFPLLQGIRFYELQANVDDANVVLDPNQIDSVHLVDNNLNWSPPLRRGIPPNAYTTIDQQGYPSCWDWGRGLEIFPAPQAYFDMYVRGRHGLTSFSADGDYTTIAPEPVLQYAIGLAKNHKKAGSGGEISANPSRWTGHFQMAASLAQRKYTMPSWKSTNPSLLVCQQRPHLAATMSAPPPTTSSPAPTP